MAVHYPADINIFACVCIDYPKAAPKDPAIKKYCFDKLNGNFTASAEHEKTLKAMMQLEQFLGREIIWVRGKSFDEVIDGAGCLPSWSRRFCTTEMKIRPIFEYLYFRYDQVRMRIGFRGDELERMIKAMQPEKAYIDYPASRNLYGDNYHSWVRVKWRETEFPLAKTSHLDIIKYWKTEHPDFDFPLDSNCRGCHHKRPELIRQNYAETPDVMEWFSLQEKKGKYNTWHDDGVSYEKKFNMNFTLNIDWDSPMCNSGACTD